MILALPRSTKFYGSIESCAFRQYAKSSMIRNNVGLYEQFADVAFNDNHQNDGGNFEVMPGDNSKHNSLGKIIIGVGPSGKVMNTNIVNFLAAQGVQEVISNVDLSWMCLGHIDEVISFATTSDGRARVASPDAAWALLVYAKRQGEGGHEVFVGMNGRVYRINEILSSPKFRRWNFAENVGFSQKIQTNVIEKLGLNSTTSTKPKSRNGEESTVLKKVGYLEGNDTVGNGNHVQWKLEFVNNSEFNIFYRNNDEMPWIFDGTGSRNQDFVSNSGICYILKEYWNTSIGNITTLENCITFETFPSPDVIAMPVLFQNADDNMFCNNALAFSNNVVNSIVDGNTLFVANVHGPVVSGVNIFNDYVIKAAQKVGFTNIVSCEDIVYHNDTGSIHCGTTVLRKIPLLGSDLEWWNLLK